LLRSSRGFALALYLAGCAVSQPQGDTPLVSGFAERALADAQSSGDVTVGVEILTPEEVASEFDLPLLEHNIWPVWLSVENATQKRLLFSPVAFDSEHFSPGEVAWRTRWAASRSFEAERAELDARQFPLLVEPGASASGFVFADLARGAKFFSVVLYSDTETYRLAFGEVAPGVKADFLEVDLDNLHAGQAVPDLGLEEFRTYLATLPPTVLGPDQATEGDPLNIVVVGEGEKILMAFGERNWDITETTTTRSALRTAMSSVLGGEYRTSPVSPLYLFERRQDFAIQKTRHTLDERNHLRLWLAPVTVEGQDVWLGQISCDIGVKLTEKTFITHKIDPDVDEARNYLLFDMLETDWFKAFGFAGGVGAAALGNPRYNYTDDPYFTDGYRLVLFQGDIKERVSDVSMLAWETPPPR